jgi:hypothetical protein
MRLYVIIGWQLTIRDDCTIIDVDEEFHLGYNTSRFCYLGAACIVAFRLLDLAVSSSGSMSVKLPQTKRATRILAVSSSGSMSVKPILV